jgi:formate hydrogenlyase transcriptional activator
MGSSETNLKWRISTRDDKFERLLEVAPDALLLIDRQGQVLLANSQAERLFGYSKEELFQQSVESLIPEQSRQTHAHHRTDYHAKPSYRPMGTGLRLEALRKDGTTFPVEISLSPWEDEGAPLVLASIRDVTDRKRAEEKLRQSEDRFRTLVEEVTDYAIFMLDPAGRVMSWNEGARKIKGYSGEEIIGRSFSQFYTSEDVEQGKPEEGLRIAAAEGRWEEEGWRIRKDGSRFWASVVITALHDKEGTVAGFTKVTRDITEGKRAREAFILEVTNALVSNLDIRQLLKAIALCLRQVKAFDYATLALYEDQTRSLRHQALGAETDSSSGESVSVSAEKSPDVWAYKHQKALLLRGVPNEQWSFELPAQLISLGIKSGGWIPLRGRDGVLGTLNLFSRQTDHVTSNDIHLLTQIASQVALALDNALAFRHISELNQKLALEKGYLDDELRSEFNFEHIIGHSKAIRSVLKQVETVASTDSTVLILGETGTGKELLARAIHDLSPRKEHTFVRINCASVPTGLLESELFGHEKGAFTGAIKQRIGRLELANRGTIFLDEVGDIALELQPKLLRVLQEKEFERLGSNQVISSDVRIIAATNRDLRKMVAAGQFRGDLFYRLDVFPILVPPLRERREDIPLLVQYFLSKFAKKMKKSIETISPDRMKALMDYSWPGNIRELEHLIERAVILTGGSVLNVPPFESAENQQPSPQLGSDTLDNVEREHIIRVLRESKGKIGGPGGAAERLGMNRTTLNSRMQKLKISRKEF